MNVDRAAERTINRVQLELDVNRTLHSKRSAAMWGAGHGLITGAVAIFIPQAVIPVVIAQGVSVINDLVETKVRTEKLEKELQELQNKP